MSNIPTGKFGSFATLLLIFISPALSSILTFFVVAARARVSFNHTTSGMACFALCEPGIGRAIHFRPFLFIGHIFGAANLDKWYSFPMFYFFAADFAVSKPLPLSFFMRALSSVFRDMSMSFDALSGYLRGAVPA